MARAAGVEMTDTYLLREHDLAHFMTIRLLGMGPIARIASMFRHFT